MFQKIGGVTVDVEDHVTATEPNGCIRMHCTIIEEFRESHCADLCAVHLGDSKCAEGDQHHVVDCKGIIQKSAHDLLNSCNAG